MKKLLSLVLLSCIMLSPHAYATIYTVGNPILIYSAPDTQASTLAFIGCEQFSILADAATGYEYVEGCSPSPTMTQIFPVGISQVIGLSGALAAKADISSLASVATSGLYSDLTGKPVNVSAFSNDSGFITSSALSPYLTVSTASTTYFAKPSGTTSQYLRGDGTTATSPTLVSSFSNDAGYLTNASLSPYLTTVGAVATYVPQTTTVAGHALSSNVSLTKTDVSLGNVDNTSDVNKPVSTAQAASIATKFTIPTGTTAQYVRGDGTLATLPGSGSRTFNYTSRALAACYQISSTQDADVNYSVDISAAISLGGGTGVITTYTNSGCTTGAQIVFNGAVSSVALLGASSIPLHAIIPAGKWVKVTATATGGGSAAIDAVQAETLLP